MCDLCDRVFLVQNQTQKLIEPINQINLESHWTMSAMKN